MITKDIPTKRVVNGYLVESSELAIVANEVQYKTSGESCILIKSSNLTTIILDHKTTDDVTIKAMCPVIIKPNTGLIDEEYEEIELSRTASVRFRLIGSQWYIVGSDGLKS